MTDVNPVAETASTGKKSWQLLLSWSVTGTVGSKHRAAEGGLSYASGVYFGRMSGWTRPAVSIVAQSKGTIE